MNRKAILAGCLLIIGCQQGRTGETYTPLHPHEAVEASKIIRGAALRVQIDWPMRPGTDNLTKIEGATPEFRRMVDAELRWYFRDGSGIEIMDHHATLGDWHTCIGKYCVVMSDKPLSAGSHGMQTPGIAFVWAGRYADKLKSQQDLDRVARQLGLLAAHEVGHRLGLRHDPRPNRVMSTDWDGAWGRRLPW